MVNELLSSIRNKEIYIPAIIIFACFLFIFVLNILFPFVFDLWNNQINDNFFKLRYFIKGKEEVSPYIINVVLDDLSIKELKIPMSDRAVFTDTINLLNEAEAHSIVCDIVFHEEINKIQDSLLVNSVRRSGKVYLPSIMGKLSAPFLTEDLSDYESEKILKQSLWYPVIKKNGNPYVADSVIMSYAELNKSSKGIGHITCTPDIDGINRRFPLLFKYKDGFIPSLTFRAVCDYLNVGQKNIKVYFGKYILLKDAEIGAGLKKDIKIPIDLKGRIVINYVGPWNDSFVVFPIRRLFNAKKDKAYFYQLYNVLNDSIAVVSDISTKNKDYQTGVFDMIYPLSSIHLTIANSILTANFIYNPPLAGTLITIVAIGALLWIFAVRFKSAGFLISSTAVYIIYWGISFLLFIYFKYLSPILPISFSMVLSLIGVIVFHAFTESKKALEKKNLELEIVHLKQMDKVKTEFVQNLSHEYKEPLTIVSGYLEEIMNMRFGAEIRAVDNIFKKMRSSCNRMLGKINNLLILEMIEIGKEKLQRRTVDVVQFLKQYIAQVRDISEQRGIKLFFNASLDCKVVDYIDEYLIEIAFSNILFNAIKYTNKGGKVTVSVEKEESLEQYRIIIADTGIGIPEDKLAFIFDRYHRADPDGTKEGSGIGLALAKKIIILHGGEIIAYSILDKGSTFEILLPYNQEIPETKVKNNYKGQNLLKYFSAGLDKNADNAGVEQSCVEKKEILIIEDSDDMIDYYKTVLSNDYSLRIAKNGKEGLKALKIAPSPDLILLDIVMPVMNGKEFINKFYENSKYCEIPVMFVTGKTSMREKMKILNKKGLYYISKPFTVDELTLTIENVIWRDEKVKQVLTKKILGKLAIGNTSQNTREDDELNYKRMMLLKQFQFSRREKEVLRLAALGKQDKEIAEHFGISIRTIQNHLQNMRKKTGVTNRTELIRYMGY